MAQRGSSKELSVRHEDYVAKLFSGKRSKSSGAAEGDAGDVRCDTLLIECKMTKGRVPTFVHHLEKVSKEAWVEGKTPMLALRYYDPDSPLSHANGWIDLVVLDAHDYYGD